MVTVLKAGTMEVAGVGRGRRLVDGERRAIQVLEDA